jgi:hypothetical protein
MQIVSTVLTRYSRPGINIILLLYLVGHSWSREVSGLFNCVIIIIITHQYARTAL